MYFGEQLAVRDRAEMRSAKFRSWIRSSAQSGDLELQSVESGLCQLPKCRVRKQRQTCSVDLIPAVLTTRVFVSSLVLCTFVSDVTGLMFG
jgi:hypothetical protein